ncbi:NaeI family type II restriction endonuclease [Nonomuraea sp. NPDC023979]|uniref:NaeI family type II restriction endonuclease n=1 Tax=Nonomuraea sp. NPDC023979 TaxID=3154796 RepID=UPI0033F95B5C
MIDESAPAPDSELERVFAHILALEDVESRFGKAIRRTFDMLLDGKNTGRYRWCKLHKTEKTHCGTLVEINLQREFTFDDGTLLDYSIAGAEVDCKYSQTLGDWMIPPEAVGQVLLGIWADDELGKWSAGLIRAEPHLLTGGQGNRDLKRRLTKDGKASVRWLFSNSDLQENLLLHMPQDDVEVIMGKKHGTQRVDELFRRAQGRIVGRTAVATVAQQEDYMKRVRGNGGARTSLKPEGIVIFGHYDKHRALARQLGLPVPAPRSGESVSARLSRRQAHHSGRPHISLQGKEWVIALPEDPVEEAPTLPSTKKSTPEKS